MSKHQKILLIPDVHIPFEDKRAWNLMMAVARNVKPDRIIVLGDFLDKYCLSTHPKDPDKRHILLKDEIDAGLARLDELDALGATHKDFLAGNHEFRLDRYIQDKAPDLFGLLTTRKLLELDRRGWAYTPYKHFKTIGKLVVTHDAGKAGLGATADAVGKFGHSVAHGHTHTFVTVVRGDAMGNKHVGCSFGWLGDPNAANYVHEIHKKMNWSHGFGLALMDSKGWVRMQPVQIFPDYSCIAFGKVYQG